MFAVFVKHMARDKRNAAARSLAQQRRGVNAREKDNALSDE